MSGIRQILGINFTMKDGVWEGMANNVIKITLDGETKCRLHDLRNGFIYNFETVTAAKCFAKRRRHGRTLAEHERAELVQMAREMFGWSIKEASKKLGVSPRTIEAWSSGARAVPKIVVIALKGGMK